ncbi:MAG TPA: HPr family phosphocarrier protein [Desulfobulbus sp.]|nr:HPr family phosphocarrier protein [Desulfobulbus sp.]
MKWQERKITVRNHCGVHGRVAARLAELAREADASLQIDSAAGPVDCTSILEVLSMALVCGTEVTVRARGSGAQGLLDAVQELLTREDDP